MSPWVRCAKALSVAALIMWFSFFGLYLYYDATRSTVGRPAEGRIYELNNHGHRVYLTRQERFGLQGLEGCAVAAFAVAFALGGGRSGAPGPLVSLRLTVLLRPGVLAGVWGEATVRRRIGGGCGSYPHAPP